MTYEDRVAACAKGFREYLDGNDNDTPKEIIRKHFPDDRLRR